MGIICSLKKQIQTTDNAQTMVLTFWPQKKSKLFVTHTKEFLSRTRIIKIQHFPFVQSFNVATIISYTCVYLWWFATIKLSPTTKSFLFFDAACPPSTSTRTRGMHRTCSYTRVFSPPNFLQAFDFIC